MVCNPAKSINIDSGQKRQMEGIIIAQMVFGPESQEILNGKIFNQSTNIKLTTPPSLSQIIPHSKPVTYVGTIQGKRNKVLTIGRPKNLRLTIKATTIPTAKVPTVTTTV